MLYLLLKDDTRLSYLLILIFIQIILNWLSYIIFFNLKFQFMFKILYKLFMYIFYKLKYFEVLTKYKNTVALYKMIAGYIIFFWLYYFVILLKKIFSLRKTHITHLHLYTSIYIYTVHMMSECLLHICKKKKTSQFGTFFHSWSELGMVWLD